MDTLMGMQTRFIELCRAVAQDLSEAELKAVLRNPEYFQAFLLVKIQSTQWVGRPADPESPEYLDYLKSLFQGSGTNGR